jgi:hypothetical protein
MSSSSSASSFCHFISVIIFVVYLFLNLYAVWYINWCIYLQANENAYREDHWTTLNGTSTVPISIVYSILGYSQIWLNESGKLSKYSELSVIHGFSFMNPQREKSQELSTYTWGGQIFSHAWRSEYWPKMTLDQRYHGVKVSHIKLKANLFSV